MSSNTTTVRVDVSTKELILKHSKRLKLSQNKVIEHAFLCAENSNFTTELPLKSIAKNQAKETNRLIGFIKKQDENIFQLQQNLIHLITKNDIEGNYYWYEKKRRILADKLADKLINIFKEEYGDMVNIEELATSLKRRIDTKEIEQWLLE